MQKRNRLLSAVLAAAVCFVMLFSVVFVAVNADHDCTGEDCRICCLISMCENSLKLTGSAEIRSVLTAVLVFAVTAVIGIVNKYSEAFTLVSMKVRLSD